MINRPLLVVLASALNVVVLVGCVSSPPRTSYYSLYTPGQRQTAGAVPAGSTLRLSVGPVTVPDILRQGKIATGGNDGRYQLSETHRWSGGVDRDFARAVAEQLASGLGTEQVAIFPWDQHFTPTCRVLIDVLSMGGEPGQVATLAARWTLVDTRGERLAPVRRSDLRETTAGAGYQAWVAAQQRNIAKLGQEIAGEIQASVKP